jgi:CRP-like cAMP-binding protein
MIAPELLKEIALLGDLKDAELASICGCFTEESIASGETLYVEGDPATSACFLIRGELEVLKALPGGGAAKIAEIAPGHMIGETALVADGARSATVRAKTEVTVVTVLRDFFHAALDQVSVPAYKILRSVIHSVAVRLDEHQDRILEQWGCDACIPRADAVDADAAPTTKALEQFSSFDLRRFLSVVPCFASFTESEIDRFVTYAEVVELSRREYLYREATTARSCYLVVRGAIETSVNRDRRYQLSILGPGRICGANSLITGKRRCCDARARSGSLLLAFNQSAFHELYSGNDTECLKFQRMISQNQLQDRKTADNLLSTLVSQDYISDGVRYHGL